MAIVLGIIHYILIVMIVWSLFKVQLTDPGYVKNYIYVKCNLIIITSPTLV